jgi:hypothetical protein
MKCFAELPCDNVQEISKEIYNFLDLHTTLLKNPIIGWNFIDCTELLQNSPGLIKFFKDLKLRPRHAAVTILTETGQLPMHVDEPPVIAKINFPVINTKGWTNRWYKDDNIIDEKVDLDKPIVFNSQIAHSVDQTTASEVPRIIASFTFYNEPLSWLKK